MKQAAENRNNFLNGISQLLFPVNLLRLARDSYNSRNIASVFQSRENCSSALFASLSDNNAAAFRISDKNNEVKSYIEYQIDYQTFFSLKQML